MFCPHCGQVHPPGTRFCPVTGRSLPVSVPTLIPTAPATRSQQVPWAVLIGGGLTLLLLLIAGFGGAYWAYINGAFTIGNQVSEATDQMQKEAPAVVVSTISPSAETLVGSLTGTVTVTPESTSLQVSPADPRTATVAMLLTQASALEQTVVPTSTPLNLLGGRSPSGKIAFTCQVYKEPSRNQICIINPDGSGWQKMTDNASANHDAPSISPDGQYILFGSGLNGSSQIYEMDFLGNIRQLTDLPGRAYAPVVSPDNRWIAFTFKNSKHQAIWIMGRDGGNPHPILPDVQYDDFDPSWAPDSRQILFASVRAGSRQLFRTDIDGSGPEQVTHLEELRGRNDWAPDGKTLATYIGQPWHRNLILLDLEGNILRQLTDGGNSQAPNFSPDGSWLAFTAYFDLYGNDDRCEIYIVPVDGSEEPRRLTNNDYCDWQPNWGP